MKRRNLDSFWRAVNVLADIGTVTFIVLLILLGFAYLMP